MPLLKKVQIADRPKNVRIGGPWGTSHDGKRQQRALLASATTIQNGGQVNRIEAQRLPKLRQSWQDDAWAYRDSIGELRYACTYLGNAARKVKLYPAAYVEGELDPVPLEDVPEVPPEVIAAATDAMERIAINPMDMSVITRDIAENFEVAGECWMIGWAPGTHASGNDEEFWEIRSISEVFADTQGNLTVKDEGGPSRGTPLPTNAFATRLWYPHPRRKQLADSPFAALLDLAEELLILSRDIRASGRSRLANNGLLLLPDSLTVVKANIQEDANDDQQDEFMQMLIAAAQTAIQDEGSAAAIVPLIARGPRDDLNAVRQVRIERPETQRANDRLELINRMATTLDLPAEVLTGKADLNHWTAWSVSEDTFSDHIEPLIMVIDDAVVAGYLRVALKETEGIDPMWAKRVILWHDATRLVRHPDRSQDALQAFDRFAINEAGLRDTMGFSDTWAPSNTELLERMILKQTRLDPTIVAQVIKRMDSTIDVSQVSPAGVVPPIPGGPTTGQNPQAPTPTQQQPPEQGQPSQAAPSAAPATASAYPKVLTAAVHITQGNKKLARIESDLMAKIQTAANGAMTRALEKAGARIRTTVGKTASGRAWCGGHRNIELPFIISNAMMAAAGLDEHQLLNGVWEQLQAEWDTYLESYSQDTLQTLSKMLKVSPDELDKQAELYAEYGQTGWNWLQARLNSIAHGFLHDPANLVGEDEEITTTQLVPWSDIKQAIARAGGQPSSSSPGVSFGDSDPTTHTPATGFTNGPIASDTLSGGGLGISSYTWIHGTTPTPFPPHEALDGTEFADWVDDALAVDGDFPDRDYYMPGDHDGCTCDFQINWSEPAPSESEGESVAASIIPFYEDQPRAEGGRWGEGKQDGKPEAQTTRGGRQPPMSEWPQEKLDAVKNAKETAGMATGTGARLYDAGKLDDAVALGQTQQPQEVVNQARDLATQKNADAEAQITPEDKAAAEERHAQSGRAGGDDRPDYATRQSYCRQLVAESGDGKTAPCTWCGRTLEPDTVSLDRLVPGSEGGPYKMWNLTPTCYDCNNWRSDVPFSDTMDQALAWEKSMAAAGLSPAGKEPVVPLGTFVTAQALGFGGDSEHASPDEPTNIPLAIVSGKLDGYYVGTFGYFKHIVAGYDVDPATIKVVDEATADAVGMETE